MKAHAQRVSIGKAKPLVDIEDRGADSLRKLHRGLEADGHARRVFGEQQGIARFSQHIRRLFDCRRLGSDPGRNLDRGIRRQRHVFFQRAFLHCRVVTHVDGALRFAHHDRIGAGK